MANLPINIAEFDHDARISFSKLDNKYVAVHDDGDEYEFDPQLRKWVPLDDNDDGDLDAEPSRKRKQDSETANGDDDGQDGHLAAQRRPKKKQKAPPPPRQNTAVYVTNLPADATDDEINELFSRKAGMIAEDVDTGRPRIKMYCDDDGNFKGDALVVFYKPQSVNIAVMLLDETDFRFGEPLPGGKMGVQAADMSYKKENPNGQDKKSTTGASSGKQMTERERAKIKAKRQRMDAKLADWDDDAPHNAAQAVSRWDKMVILKHMFTLEELAEDPAALLDIKEDVRDECSKLGAVTNVVLFDLEPDGVVSVKFRDADAALACVATMDGRAFGGQTVRASIATGRERFKKSKGEDDE